MVSNEISIQKCELHVRLHKSTFWVFIFLGGVQWTIQSMYMDQNVGRSQFLLMEEIISTMMINTCYSDNLTV